MKKLIIAVAVGIGLLGGCSGKKEPDQTVARVGSRSIDVQELNRSYVLHPHWKKGQTELQSYLTQLHELIIQKVYAQEAERLGIDRDSTLNDYLLFIKQKEMIKGLYRREVREKVRIDSTEERQIFEWMKRSVDFEYVLSRDSARCAAYAKQMRTTGVVGVTVPGDSSVSVGTREGVQVGAVAPELERVLFTSNLRVVRGPIRTGDQFIAVKLIGGTNEKFLSENDFIAQRQKVRKLLTTRKMDSIASHYVYSMMHDKDLRLNPPVFWGIAEHFFQRVKEANVDPMKIDNVNVTSGELQMLQSDLKSMPNAIVATYRDGRLTVRELMNALAVMPGSLRPRVRTPQNLKEAIAGIVRNRYLLKEAERQGLANDSEVLYEYGLQRDETLASAYYGRRRGEIQVTPEEVQAFKQRSQISEEQVFFKFNMSALARDAKTDSLMRADLPRLATRYRVSVDTAMVVSMVKVPNAVLTENPVRMYVREIFQ